MTLWLWLAAGPAILLAAVSLWAERRRAAYVRHRLAAENPPPPPPTLIVPV